MARRSLFFFIVSCHKRVCSHGSFGRAGILPVIHAGRAISDGVDPQDSCCHGQEGPSDDVGRDKGAGAFPVGNHQEPSRAERQAGRSPAPSQGGKACAGGFITGMKWEARCESSPKPKSRNHQASSRNFCQALKHTSPSYSRTCSTMAISETMLVSHLDRSSADIIGSG